MIQGFNFFDVTRRHRIVIIEKKQKATTRLAQPQIASRRHAGTAGLLDDDAQTRILLKGAQPRSLRAVCCDRR